MKNSFITFSLMAAGLFSASGGLAQQVQKPKEATSVSRDAPPEKGQGNQPEQEREPKAGDATTRVTIIESPDQAERRRASEAKAQQDEEEERASRQEALLWTRVQIIFGLIGSAIIVATLVYTARAAKAAQRSADHAGTALQHTVAAADAAGRSAVASEKALELSREQFGQTNRAYLMLQPRPVVFRNSSFRQQDGLMSAPADWVGFFALVQNIGPTPAKQTEIWIEKSYVSAGAKPSFGGFVSSERAVVAPGQEVQTREVIINRAEYESVLHGRKDLYVAVEARYRTLFSSEVRRTSYVFKTLIHSPWEQAMGGHNFNVMFIPQDDCEMT